MATASPPERLRPPLTDTEWLLRRIWDRINRRNQHFMLCIVGEEGSGKSHTALKMAAELDPTFTADRVIFDVVDLLKILANGEHDPGNFYVLDEAGVQLGRRTWQQRSQILANQALQIIRDENLGLIFTVPALGDLDSQTQRRLQAFYELTKKKPDEYVRGKFKIMDPDRADETGKIYKKYPRRRRDGVLVRITNIGAAPPSGELVEPYESQKTEFQQRHYEETIAEFEGDEAGEDSEPQRSAREVATDIASTGLAEYVSTHSQNGQPYINADLIYADTDLSVRESKTVKALLEDQFDKSDLAELV